MSVNGLIVSSAKTLSYGSPTLQAGWHWCKQPKQGQKERYQLDFGTCSSVLFGQNQGSDLQQSTSKESKSRTDIHGVGEEVERESGHSARHEDTKVIT